MIPLERLEGELLLRLHHLLPHLVDLERKDLLGRFRAVNAIGLDRHDDPAALLQEQMRIQSYDARLIRLRHVGEHYVDHADEHAVFEGVARILDDGDDVCALRREADKVAPAAVGELDRVHDARGAHNVGHVRHGRARRCAKVEHFTARAYVDVVEAAENACGELRAKGVPHAIFGLCGGSVVAVDGGAGRLDGDAFLTVDGLAGNEVLGDEQILLAARDEDASVSVRFLRRPRR